MYARWLICLEATALGILMYCANMSDSLRYEVQIVGFDDARDVLERASARETASVRFGQSQLLRFTTGNRS